MAHLDCSFYSPTLRKNAHLIAFIPSVSADDYLEEREVDYTRPDKVWPTLFLLHGSYGDCMDWCLRTGIERYAQEKGIAVIMPSAENSNYVAMAYGEDYLAYVGEELPAFTRKILPLSREREQTFIAGLSMGGYGAFRVALEYPGTFGYAASLSGALDIAMLQANAGGEAHLRKMPANYRRATFEQPDKIGGTRDDLLFLLAREAQDKVELPSLYMSCGTEDFILPANDSFYRAAQTAHVPVVYEQYPGLHNWEYWDTHIRDVLRWLPDTKVAEA
jgi:putative tributyrin esterase